MSRGYNRYGEVRELRVLWKSRRKLLKLKYYDEDGNEQYEFTDERYSPNEAKGEEVIGHIWINEWMKGVRLASSDDDMYLDTGVLEFQMRDMDNPSKCNPGIVGTMYTMNSNTTVSFLDMMKPYQYLYNTFMYRTELAIAKSYGKMTVLDKSLMPDDVDEDEWFHYMINMGIILENPFTEANSVAGNANLSQLSRGARAIDMSNTQYISQHIELMNYVDQQCGRIAGVTMQREGQISSQETVGGVERAVMQSNNITEKYYYVHDNTKIRTMRVILEAAKYAWKELKLKKLQYTTSDMAEIIFDVDVEAFRETNYDVMITNGVDDNKILQSLQSIAQAAIQNDKINLTQLIDIYTSSSISDIRRKLEQFEEEKEMSIEQQRKEEMESKERMVKEQSESAKYINDKKI
jgi:hypothetical protein